MRLRFVVLLGVGLVSLGLSLAAAQADPLSPTDEPTGEPASPGRSPVIAVGEKLVYSVRYGKVKAGTAILEIVDQVTIGGKSALRVVATTLSNSIFDKIYPVRDRVVSFMEPDSLHSLYFEKHLREGKYKADQSVRFDQGAGVATYQDGKRFPIPRGTYDVLAAFYRVRSIPLRVGEEIFLDSHADRKNYPIQVKVLGREKVDSPFGEVECLKVEPRLRSGAFFKNEGRLTIWLTDDERRIPVLMRSKIPVGSISVVLTDMQRPEPAAADSAEAAPDSSDRGASVRTASER